MFAFLPRNYYSNTTYSLSNKNNMNGHKYTTGGFLTPWYTITTEWNFDSHNFFLYKPRILMWWTNFVTYFGYLIRLLSAHPITPAVVATKSGVWRSGRKLDLLLLTGSKLKRWRRNHCDLNHSLYVHTCSHLTSTGRKSEFFFWNTLMSLRLQTLLTGGNVCTFATKLLPKQFGRIWIYHHHQMKFLHGLQPQLLAF